MVTKAQNQVFSTWLFLALYVWACAWIGMFIPGQFSMLFKLIPTERLGQLLGILFAVQFGGIVVSGFAMQGVKIPGLNILGINIPGLTIRGINEAFEPPMNYAVLFLATFVVTLVITLILLSIKEPEGEEMEGAPSLGAYIGKCIDVVKTDKLLTKFIVGKWLMSGHYVMLAFMLAFLINERGFDPLKAGWFTSLHALGLFIGGFTITKIADIYGPKQMLVTSHIIAIIYTVIVWLIPTASPLIILSAFVITGLAQISDNVGYSNMCMLCCPTLDKSTYVAVTNVGVNLLTVPLPIIFGLLLDMKILSYNSMFGIVLCMMIAGVLFMTFVVGNPKSFIDMKAAAKA